jgi:pimeloyl-ACP methyl ester carboxylesterase
MPYAHRGHERLYFETRGDGEPLVLIRGLSRSLRFWTEDFLGPLAARYRLVLFDHRGIGRSYVEDDGFTISDMADDLATVMDAADAARARVFGISLGGLVAQELAIGHPERIERLALGATFATARATRCSCRSCLAPR